MKRFIAIWILLSAGLNIWQMDRIRDLEEKKPMVIYKLIIKALRYSVRSSRKDDMASYTRLRFVITGCSWL